MAGKNILVHRRCDKCGCNLALWSCVYDMQLEDIVEIALKCACIKDLKKITAKDVSPSYWHELKEYCYAVMCY